MYVVERVDMRASISNQRYVQVHSLNTYVCV